MPPEIRLLSSIPRLNDRFYTMDCTGTGQPFSEILFILNKLPAEHPFSFLSEKERPSRIHMPKVQFGQLLGATKDDTTTKLERRSSNPTIIRNCVNVRLINKCVVTLFHRPSQRTGRYWSNLGLIMHDTRIRIG